MPYSNQANMRRVAWQALSFFRLRDGLPLDKTALEHNLGFMVYNIDPSANKSKFYEGLITPDGDGYRVHFRWGALTDPKSGGAIRGYNFDDDPKLWFPSLSQAKRVLENKRNKELSHGYTDVMSRDHVNPSTGDKLTPGEYPLGLNRKPGFGWGTQTMSVCIPDLHYIVQDLEQALAETNHDAQTDLISRTLADALLKVKRLASEDSTMASNLKRLIWTPFKRIHGAPNFLPDKEGQRLKRELMKVISYIKGQTSYCSASRMASELPETYIMKIALKYDME